MNRNSQQSSDGNPVDVVRTRTVVGIPDHSVNVVDRPDHMLFIREEDILDRNKAGSWTSAQLDTLREKFKLFKNDNHLEIDRDFCNPRKGICTKTNPETGNDIILFPEHGDDTFFYLYPECVLEYVDWVLAHELSHAWQKRLYGVTEISMANHLRSASTAEMQRLSYGLIDSEFGFSTPPLGQYLVAKRENASWTKFLADHKEEEREILTAALDVHADARALRNRDDELVAQFLYVNSLLVCFVNSYIEENSNLLISFLSRLRANLAFLENIAQQHTSIIPKVFEKVNRVPNEMYRHYIERLKNKKNFVGQMRQTLDDTASKYLSGKHGGMEAYIQLSLVFREYLLLAGKTTALSEEAFTCLAKYLNDEEDNSLRSRAANYLADTLSPRALDLLLKRYRKETNEHILETLRFAIIHILGKVASTDAVGILNELMQKFEVGRLVNSLFELGLIGDFAPQIVYELIEQVIDGDDFNQRFGLRWTIGYFSKKHPEKALSLARRLRSKPSLTSQGTGVNCLGRIGIYHPKAALGDLEKVLSEIDDSYLLRDASVAFGEILYWSPTLALNMAKRGLSSKDAKVRSNTAYLFAYGAKYRYANRILAQLRQCLEEGDDCLQSGSAIALGFLGRNYPERVLPILTRLVEKRIQMDNNPLGVGPLLNEAAGAVGVVGRQHPRQMMKAIDHLKRAGQWRSRAAVAMAIGSMGTECDDIAIRELRTILEDNSLYARYAAGMALGKVGIYHCQKVLEEIRTYLDSPESETRMAMGAALGMMKSKHPKKVTVLLEKLCRDADPMVRHVASTALLIK
jgi:HEAT repeat protein